MRAIQQNHTNFWVKHIIQTDTLNNILRLDFPVLFFLTKTYYSAPLRIASLEEITSLGLVNKGARASDMVAFILGVDKDNVTYWTRDLSNLGSGVAITPTGTKVQTWLNQLQGMRFAYTFSEGGSTLCWKGVTNRWFFFDGVCVDYFSNSLNFNCKLCV